MKEKQPFPEVIEYIAQTISEFNISLFEYDSAGSVNAEFMQNSLKKFVEENQIRYIITGTRSTDPYTQNLTVFSKSDSNNGWPDFERVMPIYFWNYKTVWRFILENELPYCKLYHSGYTYVGDQSNTERNHFLSKKHAKFGNDNIELFSRTKLLANLKNNDGKIEFGNKNCFLILEKTDNKAESEQIVFFEFLNSHLKTYCEENHFSCNVSLEKLEKFYVDFNGQNPRDIFESVVIQKKQQSSNFAILYLGIYFSEQTNKSLFFI